MPLATIQKLARYWSTEYEWRKCEAKLRALPQGRDRESDWTMVSTTCEIA